MRRLLILIQVMIFCSVPGVVSVSQAKTAELICDGPKLTREQVKSIIKRERFVRADLPKALKEFTDQFGRQRCHYTYMEIPKKAALHKENTFILDQYGVIVDAVTGRASPHASVECPKRKLTNKEVIDFVNAERARSNDLPAAPKKLKTRVTPKRCMYVYYEFAETGDKNKRAYLSFTVDQYGGVYSVHRQGLK